MKDTLLFKKVMFGGFRKDDVLAYVEKLEKENEELQISRNDEINRLQEELASWKSKYAELQNSTSMTIGQMEAQMNGIQDKWKAKYEKLEENTALTISLLKEQLSRAQDETERLVVREKPDGRWEKIKQRLRNVGKNRE